MDPALIVQKLSGLQARIPEFKGKHLPFLGNSEFSNWHSSLIKWLKLGLPYTAGELKSIEEWRCVLVNLGGPRHNPDGERVYQNFLDVTSHAIDSAIENLENGFIPEQPELQTEEKKGNHSKYGGVNVGQANTVVVGDSNLITMVNEVTIKDFLTILEREVDKKAGDVEEKKGLVQKLKEI